MASYTTIFTSVGAAHIAVDEDYVVIEQDIEGFDEESIMIPRVLFKEVLNSIFSHMYPSELREIAELAEWFAVENKEG